MGKQTYLSEDEEKMIRQSLGEGRADEVFEQMAIYLERNHLQLSDHVLRLYIEKDLFKCLSGQGRTFSDFMSN